MYFRNTKIILNTSIVISHIFDELAYFLKVQKIIFCKYLGIQQSNFDEFFLNYRVKLGLQNKKKFIKFGLLNAEIFIKNDFLSFGKKWCFYFLAKSPL
jgi:hypothetical protein